MSPYWGRRIVEYMNETFCPVCDRIQDLLTEWAGAEPARIYGLKMQNHGVENR